MTSTHRITPLFGALLLHSLCTILISCSSDGQKEEPEPMCVSGELTCSDDSASVEKCNDEGSAFELLKSCPAHTSCVNGHCRCPDGKVSGPEGCFSPGVTVCPDWADKTEDGCKAAPGSCSAKEIFAGGKCSKVGVQVCPDGFVEDPDTYGCKLDEQSCSEGKDWLIGKGCALFGAQVPCGEPTNPYAVIEGTSNIVFVNQASVAETEDGTSQAPFKTIQPAIDAAADGDVVAIGTGLYDGGVVIDKSVRIVGKCPQNVVIKGGMLVTPIKQGYPGRYGIVIKGAEKVEISGLAFADSEAKAGERACGLLAENSGELYVHDVLIKELNGAGMHFYGNDKVEIERCTFDQMAVAAASPYGETSYAIFMQGNKSARLEGNFFFKTQGLDVGGEGCALIVANRFEKRGLPGALSPIGIWLKKCMGGEIRIESNLMLDKMTHAARIEGGKAVIQGNIIKSTVTDYEDVNGGALSLEATDFTVSGNYLSGNQYVSVLIKDGFGTIEGNRVESTIPSDPKLRAGYGISINGCDPDPASVIGNTIVAATRAGILVTSSIALLENNSILDTQPNPDGTGASPAINVVEGSDVVIRGNIVRGSRVAGLRFQKSYGKVLGNSVTETKPPLSGNDCGAGILVIESALPGGILNNLISGNYANGIHLFNSNVGTIADNIIETTITGPSPTPGAGISSFSSLADIKGNWVRNNEGPGIILKNKATVVSGNRIESNGLDALAGGILLESIPQVYVLIEENTIVDNGFAGLRANSSRLTAERNVIASTRPGKTTKGGAGVWLEAECEAEVRQNRIVDNRLAGVAVFEGAEITISTNFIAETGSAEWTAGDESYSFGDGILVAKESLVSALYNRVEKSSAAGFAIFDSVFVTQGNEFVKNGTFGLEVVRSQMSTSDDSSYDSNDFEDNASGTVIDNPGRSAPSGAKKPSLPCALPTT